MAYWDSNEGSGDTLYDISGNGNHGTIHGAQFSEDVPENNCSESDDNINNSEYEIGDFAEGGVIFYIDESGTRGLVASSESLLGYPFGCDFISTLATGSYVGSGFQNTLSIIEQSCTSSNGDTTAAHAAYYFNNEIGQWWLPSIDELVLMYQNIGPTSQFDFQFTDNTPDTHFQYWSSTDLNIDSVGVGSYYDSYALQFIDGSIILNNKVDQMYIRPIRAFGNWTMGCMDETACNYNAEANMSDGSCTYPELFYDCSGELIPVLGCLNSLAINYDELATVEDGSCLYSADVYLDLLESNSNLEEELSVYETVEEEQDYSMSFDGIDDYVNLGDIDYINSGQQNEYTISCWVKIDDLSFSENQEILWILGDEQLSNQGVGLFMHPEYGISAAGGTGGTWPSSSFNYHPNQNQWNHLTLQQVNGVGLKLYVNGLYYQTTSNSPNLEVNTDFS